MKQILKFSELTNESIIDKLTGIDDDEYNKVLDKKIKQLKDIQESDIYVNFLNNLYKTKSDQKELMGIIMNSFDFIDLLYMILEHIDEYASKSNRSKILKDKIYNDLFNAIEKKKDKFKDMELYTMFADFGI